MKKKRSKLLQPLLGILILFVILTVIVLRYGTNKFKKNVYTPPSLQVLPTGLSLDEAQKPFIPQQETIIKALSQKNNWKETDFMFTPTYMDRYFIIGNITSENQAIPKGETLILVNRTGSYSVVYDPTTPDPCAAVTNSSIPLPVPVAKRCHK